MQCANFTLESLGLKGNYCVTISYVNSEETNIKFLEFLDANKIDQIKPLESSIAVGENKGKNLSNLPFPPSITEMAELKCENKQSDSFDVPFTAHRISRSTCSARTLNLYFHAINLLNI